MQSESLKNIPKTIAQTAFNKTVKVIDRLVPKHLRSEWEALKVRLAGEQYAELRNGGDISIALGLLTSDRRSHVRDSEVQGFLQQYVSEIKTALSAKGKNVEAIAIDSQFAELFPALTGGRGFGD